MTAVTDMWNKRTDCGHVKAGEGAAGADASAHMDSRGRESKRDRKETDGAAGLWATGCGHVKAGEGAAGADARCSWEPQGLRLLLLHALSLPLPNR